MTFTRRDFIVGSMAAAALPQLAQALEKPKHTIAVGGKNLFYYLPLTIAEQLGYFKAEGLDVTIVDFAGGSRALQAVVGGSADVVSGAFEHTINMQFKGQPMRAFVLQGAAPQIVLGVNPKTLPNFKSVADLKGKKVGVTSRGSGAEFQLLDMLKGAGMSGSDVTIVPVGAPNTALPAIQPWQTAPPCCSTRSFFFETRTSRPNSSCALRRPCASRSSTPLSKALTDFRTSSKSRSWSTRR